MLGNTFGKTVSMAKIPFAVQGTASSPKIIPDVGGALGGMVSGLGGALGGVARGRVGNTGVPVQQLDKSLGGLFKKH